MCIVCIVFGKDYRQYTFSMGSHSSNNQRWPNRMCKVLVIDPLMWLFTVTVPRLDKDDSYLSHGERKGEGREAVDSPLPPSPLLPVPMHRQQGGHVPRWRRIGRGRRKGDGGSGRSTASLPSPFSSAPDAKDMSHLYLIVQRWLWTITSEDQAQELYPFDLANVGYCYCVNP